ncbi:MAG: hypothetical protein AAF438_20505, partial [Pseudomonadota bacterium]
MLNVAKNFFAKHKVVSISILAIFVMLVVSLFVTIMALKESDTKEQDSRAMLDKVLSTLDFAIKSNEEL